MLILLWRQWLGSVLLTASLPTVVVCQNRQSDWVAAYRVAADRIITSATADDTAWKRLAELTDTFGPRLSGSRNLAQAIDWAVSTLRNDGLENVHTEPVHVPKWERGEEQLELLDPAPRRIPLLGLGGSVGTPDSGIVAEALVVRSFDELEREADQARGRIVIFNVPYTNYDTTVRYRGAGASRAARHDAVAALVRSVGPMGLRTVHTGSLSYDTTAVKIPGAAISAEDVNMLQRLQDRGVPIRLRLQMGARQESDTESANVVAELRGRERPDEIVVVGGHLDSWDVGSGATDDGAGCIATWEAVRLLKRLNLRPRRTIRLVLWTNEENGLRGGRAYQEQHRGELGKHVFMLESDFGVFTPLFFGFTGSARDRTTVEAITTLLSKIGVEREVAASADIPDVRPSAQSGNIPAASLNGNPEKYFVIHHTPADMMDRIAPGEVSRAVAAIAVMAYVLAEMPERPEL